MSWRIYLAWFGFLCCFPAFALAAEDGEGRYSRAVLIQLQGPITPLLEQYLYRKIETAKKQQADLLIIEIDSPGGFVTTTLNMAERLRDLSWARTVAFIPREAISGAAILSLACDDILIAPQGRMGDAGQIMLGEDNAFRYVPEKERSVLVRHVRDLAIATGRPPALAEAMVDMDLVVYHVKNSSTGEETYMSEAELQSADDAEDWEKLKPVHESREKHFLTVNGQQAVELQLAAGTAETRQDLRQRYGLDRLTVLEQTATDTIVTVLNWKVVTGLLLVIGLISLYIEFSAPGIGIGGLISFLCFAIFFWSRFLGGTAGWLEVVLFTVGVLFVLMELFVIPGFGVAGIAGLLLMVSSVLMASQHFIIPSTDLEMSAMAGSLGVVVVSGIASIVAAVAISRYLGTIPVLGWLVLQPPKFGEGERGTVSQPVTHLAAKIGDQGVAESALRPAGRALFDGRYVDVVADGSFVDAGRQVRVVDTSGNRVVVREVEPPSQ